MRPPSPKLRARARAYTRLYAHTRTSHHACTRLEGQGEAEAEARALAERAGDALPLSLPRSVARLCHGRRSLRLWRAIALAGCAHPDAASGRRHACG